MITREWWMPTPVFTGVGFARGVWGMRMGPRMREDKEGEVFTPIPRLHEGRL